MKTLFVLRHAKSSWRDLSLPDHDRPLKKRGRKIAPRMGRWARVNEVWPDVVLSSTALRAWATARAFLEGGKYDVKIQPEPRLYEASVTTVIDLLHQREEHAVMVVGHNPTMENLVSTLTTEKVRFVTAALAWIELPIESWSEFVPSTRGHLKAFWNPRALKIKA